MCIQNWFKKNPKPIGPAFDPTGYKTVLYENYARNIPIDFTKWTHTYIGGQDQKELTKWVPECVLPSPFGLRLIAKGGKEIGINLCGQICSYPFFNFKYGYVSVRAKVPPLGGIYFPAIWLFNRITGWLPEWDIMEMAGGESNQVWFTHHWDNNGSPANEGTDLLWQKTDFSQDFHTYSGEWTPDKLTWYIDGMPYYTTTNKIPQDALFIICGIQAGGSPPFTRLFEPNEVPAEMIIQSIQVMQK